MAHWFISHATKDGAAEALALTGALEARGEACWIAPRNVEAGVPYPGQIKRAVEGAKGLVLLVTAGACASTDVLQEVQIANQAKVKITPIIVRAAKPSDDLAYYIGVRHQVPWSGAAAAADAVAGARPMTPAAVAEPKVMSTPGANFGPVRIPPVRVEVGKHTSEPVTALERAEAKAEAAMAGGRTALVWLAVLVAAAVGVGLFLWAPWRGPSG